MSKKISWSQFRIKDLKPNLIANGWDSFEPYGSGKNYVENWNFEGSMSAWSNYAHINEERQVNVGYQWNLSQKDFSIPKGEYVVRIKYKGLGEEGSRARIAYGPSGKHFNVHTNYTKGWSVHEAKVQIESELNDTLYVLSGNPNRKVLVDWVQITPVNNQHLVIEKTPLGNGLTRIQTWGGNAKTKLEYTINNGFGKGRTVTYSCYIKEVSSPNLRVYTHPWGEEVYENGNVDETYVNSQAFQEANISFKFSTPDDNGNLDFVASEPQIIEGNKANPVLVVQKLDDGREHVKVYGATPETTLVYDEAGFKGELYSFETEIENQGTHMKMTSTVGDYEKIIEDDVTEIKQEGNLTSPTLEIKLGATDE